MLLFVNDTVSCIHVNWLSAR